MFPASVRKYHSKYKVRVGRKLVETQTGSLSVTTFETCRDNIVELCVGWGSVG